MIRSIENVPSYCFGHSRRQMLLSFPIRVVRFLSFLFLTLFSNKVWAQSIPTNTTLISSSSPACEGTSLTFSATVDQPAATGTVDFLITEYLWGTRHTDWHNGNFHNHSSSRNTSNNSCLFRRLNLYNQHGCIFAIRKRITDSKRRVHLSVLAAL